MWQNVLGAYFIPFGEICSKMSFRCVRAVRLPHLRQRQAASLANRNNVFGCQGNPKIVSILFETSTPPRCVLDSSFAMPTKGNHCKNTRRLSSLLENEFVKLKVFRQQPQYLRAHLQYFERYCTSQPCWLRLLSCRSDRRWRDVPSAASIQKTTHSKIRKPSY